MEEMIQVLRDRALIAACEFSQNPTLATRDRLLAAREVLREAMEYFGIPPESKSEPQKLPLLFG